MSKIVKPFWKRINKLRNDKLINKAIPVIKQDNNLYKTDLEQVLRNFKFYQTFKPRPLQNSNTFFFSKSFKTYLKIYFNQFKLILLKKKNF
jgi:hypothetical protein